MQILNLKIETSDVVFVNSIEGLALIHEPNCPAVILERPKKPDFANWLANLVPDKLPQARITVHINDLENALLEICKEANMPDVPERSTWINDVIQLAKAYSDIMVSPNIKLRLDIIDTNACRKFHVDYLNARLVCTYRGTGTQYGFTFTDADPDEIFTVPHAAPLLMRGANWQESPKSGFKHRSPPIEGSGETRLLLVLDPADSYYD